MLHCVQPLVPAIAPTRAHRRAEQVDDRLPGGDAGGVGARRDFHDVQTDHAAVADQTP
jgi:hypothetical protein